MPSNITTIEHTYDLPGGELLMVQVKDETEAASYAKGRRAYLYRSTIIDAAYLFVPVEVPS